MYEIITQLILKLLSYVLSYSKTLREQYFELKDEHELMWTALDDIARMDKDGKMGQFAEKILKKIESAK